MSDMLPLLLAADWVMPVLFGVGIFAVIFFGIFGIARDGLREHLAPGIHVERGCHSP